MTPTVIGPMDSHTKLILTLIASSALVGVAGAQIHSRRAAGSDENSGARLEVARNQGVAVHGDWGVEVARKSFDVRPGGAVEIEVEDSDVILESTTSSTIEVILYIDADETFAKELFQDMEFDAALENNIVRVEARDGDADFDSWDDHANVVTVVRFPRTSDVSVRTSDGDILAGEIEGDVTLLSSDGDIVLDGVMEGELEVRTSDGDIVIDLIEAASARIGTSDGDILLGRVDSPLSVSSGDGDVQVSLARAHETQISTGDGDILLTAPESLSAELLIDAEDVDLSSTFEVQGTLRSGVVRGTLNGGGPTIEVRTGDGTVTFRPGR